MTAPLSAVLHSRPIELRPYTLDDEEPFVALFQDPEVARYMGEGRQSEAADRALFHRVFSQVYPTDKFAVWAVLADSEIIGHAELKPSPREDIGGWELIYAIRRSHWRQGHGRQVASMIISYGLNELELPAVFATVDTENAPSISLLASLGFERIGETLEDGQRVVILSIHEAPRLALRVSSDSAAIHRDTPGRSSS